MPAADIRKLGLALSGGGSRAAAFHRGTLRGLIELGLVARIDVVSTVSGGSLFGGAWMAARANGVTDDIFLATMGTELTKGFVARSVRPAFFKTLVPGLGYSRTNLIAETFDRIFFHGKTLAELPDHPALCINTTILNDGQVGKFAKDGFSAWGLRKPGAEVSHVVPLPAFSLALAVAASAAFPIGLPPVTLDWSNLAPDVTLTGSLTGATKMAVTDGGVLENLGVQTLLASERFGTWDMVVSDAGVRDEPWRPRLP